MKARTSTLAGVVFGTLLLAGCDGGGGGGDDAEGIETLGADFVAMFARALNDEPVDAQDVSLTLRPMDQPFNP